MGSESEGLGGKVARGLGLWRVRSVLPGAHPAPTPGGGDNPKRGPGSGRVGWGGGEPSAEPLQKEVGPGSHLVKVPRTASLAAGAQFAGKATFWCPPPSEGAGATLMLGPPPGVVFQGGREGEGTAGTRQGAGLLAHSTRCLSPAWNQTPAPQLLRRRGLGC